jgi:hypothetical protein
MQFRRLFAAGAIALALSGVAATSARGGGVAIDGDRALLDVQVRRNEAKRSITLFTPVGLPAVQREVSATAKKGTLVAKNLSSGSIDIWVSYDKPNSTWYYVGDLDPGWQFTLRGMKQVRYRIAAQKKGNDTDTWDWAPYAFKLKKTFTYSFYD